jgi:hypothetical protein
MPTNDEIIKKFRKDNKIPLQAKYWLGIAYVGIGMNIIGVILTFTDSWELGFRLIWSSLVPITFGMILSINSLNKVIIQKPHNPKE